MKVKELIAWLDQSASESIVEIYNSEEETFVELEPFLLRTALYMEGPDE